MSSKRKAVKRWKPQLAVYWNVLIAVAESPADLAVLHEKCQAAGVAPRGVRLRGTHLRRLESPVRGPRGVEDVA